MTGAASLSSAHRRVRDGGVLVILIWVAFHLLACVHSHGPAFASQHHQPNTLSVAAFAAPGGGTAGGATASPPQRAPCCPETGDHAVDRVRSDAPSPPVLGGALLTDARPDVADAGLTGAGAARAPGQGAAGGRCILTALCVART